MGGVGGNLKEYGCFLGEGERGLNVELLGSGDDFWDVCEGERGYDIDVEGKCWGDEEKGEDEGDEEDVEGDEFDGGRGEEEVDEYEKEFVVVLEGWEEEGEK